MAKIETDEDGTLTIEPGKAPDIFTITIDRTTLGGAAMGHTLTPDYDLALEAASKLPANQGPSVILLLIYPDGTQPGTQPAPPTSETYGQQGEAAA